MSLPTAPSTHSEGGCTSQFRSLVKISSLARSSWFHSSSSFSCPFQLSLSCSLVLKAADEEQSQAHLSALVLTLPGQDSFQVAFPRLKHIFPTGGWRMLEAQGCIYGPRAPHNQDHHKASFRLLRVLPESCTLYTREIPQDSQWSPTSIPKALQTAVPNYLVWVFPTLRGLVTAAVACPQPFRGREAPHCGRTLALRRWHCPKETCSRE